MVFPETHKKQSNTAYGTSTYGPKDYGNLNQKQTATPMFGTAVFPRSSSTVPGKYPRKQKMDKDVVAPTCNAVSLSNEICVIRPVAA